MVRIQQVLWDEWNIEHISLHGVSSVEVEKALTDPSVVFLPTYNDRILVLGRSGERLLSVVMAKEKEGVFYIVTARDMSKKERSRYRNE